MTTMPILENDAEVRRDWQLVIHPDMVLRAQGASPDRIRGRQPKLVSLAQRAIADGMTLIHPRAVLRSFKVAKRSRERLLLENGTELQGSGIARKLTGAEMIAVAVATLGEELDREIEERQGRDLPYALALDGFGTAAIGELTNAITQQVHSLAEGMHLKATKPLHPGTVDWDLSSGQAEIFSLVDARKVGVTLNASFLMTPRKSVSMLYGIGKSVKAGKSACVNCGVSARCMHKPASDVQHVKR